MALNFPNNPGDGELFPLSPLANQKQYVYSTSSQRWEVVVNPSSPVVGFVPETSRVDSADMPTGTTLERSVTPEEGYLRYNSETSFFEGFQNNKWCSLSPILNSVISYNVSDVIELTNLLDYLQSIEIGSEAEIDINCSPGTYTFTSPYVLRKDLSKVRIIGASLLAPIPFGLSSSGPNGFQSGNGFAYINRPTNSDFNNTLQANRTYLLNTFTTIFTGSSGILNLVSAKLGELRNIAFISNDLDITSINSQTNRPLSINLNSSVAKLDSVCILGYIDGILISNASSIGEIINSSFINNIFNISITNNSVINFFNGNTILNAQSDGIVCVRNSLGYIFNSDSNGIYFSFNGRRGINSSISSNVDVQANGFNTFIDISGNSETGIFCNSGGSISLNMAYIINNNLTGVSSSRASHISLFNPTTINSTINDNSNALICTSGSVIYAEDFSISGTTVQALNCSTHSVINLISATIISGNNNASATDLSLIKKIPFFTTIDSTTNNSIIS